MMPTHEGAVPDGGSQRQQPHLRHVPGFSNV